MPKTPHTTRNAEQTKRDILHTALEEFASFGLAGARVDRIAEAMQTTKGMIYYYFGNKEGLYKAVLEQIYTELRKEEEGLSLKELPPLTALERLIDFSIDYHEKHSAFVRLVMIENINDAHYLRETGLDSIARYKILTALDDIIERGRLSGVFKREIYPVDLHLLYSSFCFYRISNRATVNTILGLNMLNSDNAKRHKRMIKDAIIAYMTSSSDN